MSIRLALVDDHQLFRELFASFVMSQPDFEIVAQACTAREACEQVERTHPDVVLMDVALPGVNGIAAVAELKRRKAPAHVLMLSMHSEGEYVARAFAAGALGYALKTEPAGELLGAIHLVARGQRYLSPSLSSSPTPDDGMLPPARQSSYGALSPRECEVFDLLVRGYTNVRIAGQLFISPKTVETHRSRVLKKMGVHSVVELVRYAARHDLITD